MNHSQKAKQQKSNLDKIDKILANLPETQYDHSEEKTAEKKPAKAKNTKKQPVQKKQGAKKENSEKVSAEEKKGWSWNRKKR